MDSEVKIFPFSNEYKDDFAKLNYEWLEEFFVIEPHDREMLDAPQEYIIDKGGEILLAQYDGKIVGTVAMIKITNDYFELAKMAVTRQYRGLKLGRKLMEAAIDFAKSNNIKTIMLESNRKLQPALKLYESVGFVEIPSDPNSPYDRADIKMEKIIN